MGMYANREPTFQQRVERRTRELQAEVKRLAAMIADAEESLARQGWPEIATELSFLEGKRAELEARLDNLLGPDDAATLARWER